MKCQNCKKHTDIDRWIGEGSVMDVVHGHYEYWCKCCMLKAQIKYAKKIAKNLPKLERKLVKVRCI